jgi:hypothetical protein
VAPDSFRGGAELRPEADRAKFRRAVLELLGTGARFAYKDQVWKVTDIDLLPP